MSQTEPQGVLLINPHPRMHVQDGRRGIFRHSPEIPMSIAFLAAYLEEQNIPVACLDLAVAEDPFEALHQRLQAERPRYVGITSLSSAMPSAKIVADECRRALGDQVTIIMGGLHASSIRERFLRDYPVFDYLVHGEGELTLTELIRTLDAGQPVDPILGLCFRRGEEQRVNEPRPFIKNLDDLPFPARHLLPMEKYTPSLHTGNYYRLPSTGIIGSRGCPYSCNYCSKGVWGRTIRFRSAKRILEEIRHCMEAYGIRDFRFYDDAITLPNGPVHELCDLLIDQRIPITWNCYSRVNGIREELIRKMKKAGCYHIKYGIEFGTERALTIANKRTSLKQAEDVVRWTKKAKIECKGNFFMGLPGETWEDCKATVDFAIKLNPDLVSFGVFEFIPGSLFYRRLHSPEGQALADSCLPADRLYKLAARAHLRFYLRFAYWVQALKRTLRNPRREIFKNAAGCVQLLRFFLSRLQQKKTKPVPEGTPMPEVPRVEKATEVLELSHK